MKTQLYTLPMTDEHRENIASAQFVHLDNYSPIVCGFISKISYELGEITICLFDPTEPPKGATVIKETLTQDEVMNHLEGALCENPSMRNVWAEIVQSSCSTN